MCGAGATVIGRSIMALTRSVITALDRQGIDLLGTKNVAIKLTDEKSIV